MKKPSHLTEECEQMLDEAYAWTIEHFSRQQAQVFMAQFYTLLGIIETLPGLGRMEPDGTRSFLIGKSPVRMYYEEMEDRIEVVGLWDGRRGTSFSER